MRTDRRTRLAGRLARAARTSVFVAVVSVALGVTAARQVRAGAVEATGESSAVLAQLAGLPELGPGQTRLSVNGERVEVAAAVIARPVDDVAAGLEKSCRAGLPGMESAEADASAARPRGGRLDLAGALLDATRAVTSRDGDTTTVLCLADTADTRGASLPQRLAAFTRTRDVAELGSLRHFTLTPVKSGTRSGTRVIAAWLPARFPLDRVFPARGDAPGADAEGMPRPARARRLLTAAAEGQPSVVRVYEVDGAEASAGDVARGYLGALEAAGWRAHDGVAARMPAGAAIYGLGERDVLVQVRSEARTGRVFVSTIDMRAPRADK